MTRTVSHHRVKLSELTANQQRADVAPEPTPFASFRFHGEVVSLTPAQFEQALRDAVKCRCGDCLCCRAREYANETRYGRPA